jgi:HEAT repeat protein
MEKLMPFNFRGFFLFTLFFSLIFSAQAHATSTPIYNIIDSLRPEKDEATHLAGFHAVQEMGTQQVVQELIVAAKSGDEQTIRGAIYALGEIGPEAYTSIPLLISYLDENAGSGPQCCKKAFFDRKWWFFGGEFAKRSPNTWIRLNSALALGKFGAAAKEAVPALLNSAEEDPDGGIWDAARNSLEQIGFPSIPFLKKKVHGDYLDTWEAYSLKNILPGFTLTDFYKGDNGNVNNCRSIDQLLELIQKDTYSPDTTISFHAHFRLSESLSCLARDISRQMDKSTAQKVLPVVQYVWKMKDTLKENKDQILQALTSVSGALGSYGESTVPFLIDELEHGRDYAIVALESIGPKAVTPLTKVLENPDWKVRIKAVRALETIYTQESWGAVKLFWKQHPEFVYPYPADEELHQYIGDPR